MAAHPLTGLAAFFLLGALRAVFGPVGFWDVPATAQDALFSFPAVEQGGAQAFVSPAELPAANARRYAAWTHNGRELTLLNRRDVLSIRTGSARFEIVTFAPVQRDAYAILGIVSLWAAAASVLQIEETPSGVTVSLAGPGEFAAAFMDRPKEVRCNGKPLSFVWVEESGLLLARLPDIPSPTVSIRF